MAKICVLGCGMVGSAIVKDLAPHHSVLATDASTTALQGLAQVKNVNVQPLDVRDVPALQATIAACELVINAVPGQLGFATLREVITAGKPVVDIAFYPEDALTLDELAKQRQVTAVVDMGVAPGMSNLVLGYHADRMQVESFKCYVGGLPKVRRWPFYYKAPFSPVDVIEEYTRPARLKEHGHVMEKPALSDRELLEFDQVGTLEAFNTDGLRSLLTTMAQIPNLVEKTLRFPGHAELIEVLKHSGFFQENALSINGQAVVPRELTSHLLREQWRLQPGEREFTVMRMVIEGQQDSKNQTIQYDLFDEYDDVTRTSSMARTTGYACTAAANLVLSGHYQQPGISPPEYLGRESTCFEYLMDYLRQRSIDYRKTSNYPGTDRKE